MPTDSIDNNEQLRFKVKFSVKDNFGVYQLELVWSHEPIAAIICDSIKRKIV
jgi:hypothetical protein